MLWWPDITTISKIERVKKNTKCCICMNNLLHVCMYVIQDKTERTAALGPDFTTQIFQQLQNVPH